MGSTTSCPGGHGLTVFTTPHDRLRCNACVGSIPRGSAVYRCNPCDYDVCIDCFSPSVLECPRHHGLRASQAPAQALSCDVCFGAIPGGSSGYGCRPCNYDVCSYCRLDCPGRHGLESFTTPNPTFSCNLCRVPMDVGIRAYGCRRCNYDVCTSCSTGHRRHVTRVITVGTNASGFRLNVLQPSHPKYSAIFKQFIDKWMKPGKPTVLSIVGVKVPAEVYRRTVGFKRNSSNVRRRFHGTSASPSCNFYTNLANGTPCTRGDCRVCSICTQGFLLRGNVGATARRVNFVLRYGEGLYFSSTSGKANDYASSSERIGSSGKRVRCMFVASVTAGKAFCTQAAGLPQTQCPPAGFDSVVGEVGPNLNHDELVVYDQRAALPTHLIVYSLS